MARSCPGHATRWLGTCRAMAGHHGDLGTG
ncbi:hypothetical protein COLO4_06589 [Corchorus olitorius]|uniref:Uncharacterized protein n=1 Tax=Corchorus olitorius TaxID=93759 RepID=A0A1R3KMK1_9ROSI|nr:hypothetical protein COLO4_06589 [Corchorus olitorius]